MVFLLGGENEPPSVDGNMDRVAVFEFPFKEVEAERVENPVLNDPFERPCPIGRVVTLHRDLGKSLVGELQS